MKKQTKNKKLNDPRYHSSLGWKKKIDRREPEALFGAFIGLGALFLFIMLGIAGLASIGMLIEYLLVDNPHPLQLIVPIIVLAIDYTILMGAMSQSDTSL